MKARRLEERSGPPFLDDEFSLKYRVFPLKMGNLPYSFISRVFVRWTEPVA
jgi:hypothetical protein